MQEQLLMGTAGVSHYGSGGQMWTGNGSREHVEYVTFSRRFRSAPRVSVAVSNLDCPGPLRITVSAADITDEGFNLRFHTWGDTKIASVQASWIAYG